MPGEKLQTGRLNWLDGLRALAILLVVLVHSGQGVRGITGWVKEISQAGQYGVQVFFVISAVAIYLSLDRQFAEKKSLMGWYLKRFLRIAPLYYFGIVLYTAYRYNVQDQNTPLMSIISNGVFAHGFVPAANNSVVPGGWSIAVEMTFYAIAPLAIYALRLRLWWVLFLLAISSSIAISHFASSELQIKNNSFYYFWPFTQAPIFLVTIGAVHAFRKKIFGENTGQALTVIPITLILFISICLGLHFGTYGNVAHLLAPTFIGVAATALLFLAHSSLSNIFGSYPMIWIGRHSYSIYILHFIVLDGVRYLVVGYSGLTGDVRFIVTFIATFALTCVFSIVSRHLIEAPFINLDRKLNFKTASGD